MSTKRTASDHTRNVRPASEAPAFLPEGAFVVQFKTGNAPNGSLVGRAEHVTSGRAIHFGSPAELMAFLSDVLRPYRS